MLSAEEAYAYCQRCLFKLQNTFNGDQLKNRSDHMCLVDVTDGHTVEGVLDGRAQNAAGLELFLLLVSRVFEGKSRVQRHQMITSVLDEEFKSGEVHSIQIRAWTPKQWEEKGKPTNLRSKSCVQL